MKLTPEAENKIISFLKQQKDALKGIIHNWNGSLTHHDYLPCLNGHWERDAWNKSFNSTENKFRFKFDDNPSLSIVIGHIDNLSAWFTVDYLEDWGSDGTCWSVKISSKEIVLSPDLSVFSKAVLDLLMEVLMIEHTKSAEEYGKTLSDYVVKALDELKY